MTLAALAVQNIAPAQVAVFDFSGANNRAEISQIWDGAAHHDPDSHPALEYLSVAGANLGAVMRAGLAQWGFEAGEDEWLWILHDDSPPEEPALEDRKSTRLNSSHVAISYAVFCLTQKTAH